MTTNDEQYREVLGYYTRGRDENYPLDPGSISGEGGDEYRAEFDRFLSRVRRDAAREALDGLIAWHRENARDAETPAPVRRGIAVMADEAQRYRNTLHPEETP